MNFNALAQMVQQRGLDLTLHTFASVDSTNARAAEMAQAAGDPVTLLVANQQTQGKGRQGRGWVSPPDKGILATLVLPAYDTEKLYVPAISVAICQELISRGAQQASIKWPNDILINGKKVSGILGETSKDGDDGTSLVLGFGINVYHGPDDFPESIKDTATSLWIESDNPGAMEEILVNIVCHFFELLGLPPHDLLDRYRSLSSTIGRHCFLDGRRVLAQGVIGNGGLVILNEVGKQETVFSGTLRYE